MIHRNHSIIFLAVIIISIYDVYAHRAIVTLLSGPPENAERYTRFLHFFVYSLRISGYTGEVAVMHTKEFPIKHDKLAKLLDVTLIPVDKIVIPHNKKNSQYSSMLTKLHAWSLTQYDHIIYYDSDFIFQSNPESAFDECFWSSLCATPDTGIRNFYKNVKAGSYFNGGFLVIRPNKETYESLLKEQHRTHDKFFVEQDLLNEIYKNTWGKLNQRYNLMHCYQQQEIEPEVVAVHEKMWILRKSFPQRHYIWNSPKLQIPYPITDVLTLSAAGTTKTPPTHPVNSTSNYSSDTNTVTSKAASALPVIRVNSTDPIARRTSNPGASSVRFDQAKRLYMEEMKKRREGLRQREAQRRQDQQQRQQQQVSAQQVETPQQLQ